MRSVVRGVALFAVGTMLCAGLVFTADRGVGVSSSKADRVRASEAGQTNRPMHPTRIHRVTRDDVMEFLGLGARSSATPAGAKAGLMIDHASNMASKGDTVGAIEFLQSQRGFQVPDESLGAFHTLLGDLYAQQDGSVAQLRAAGNFERAARYTDDRDGAIDLLQRAGDAYRSVGRIDAAARADQTLDNVRRGRTETNDFGRASGFTANVRTIGVGDTCDVATAVALPYAEAGLNIENDPFGTGAVDQDFYTFDLTEGTIVTMQTDSVDTFDDTNLTLYSGCDAGVASPEIAFDEDGGPGFLSIIEECLGAGTYYLRVGGWLDSAAPDDFELSITTGGTCFVPEPDEFEPDNEVNASFIGCETLAAEDEENEDEEDEGSGSDSEDDESSEDEFSGKTCEERSGSSGSSSGSGSGSEARFTICKDGHKNKCVKESKLQDYLDDGATLGACGSDQGTVCELLQTQCRTIFPAGDIDFAVFNAGDTPRRIVVETGGAEECGNTPEDVTGTGPDTIIAITDAFGNIFAINDDKGGGSFGSRFEFCAPANQDFNVAVLGFSASDQFAYQLTVDATLECQTEQEANGACEIANDIGVIPTDGTIVQIGGFHTPFNDPFGATFIEDQDWYTFVLEEGCTIVVLTDATDTQRTDTELELYIEGTFFDPLAPACPPASIGFSDDLDTFGGVWTSGLTGDLPAARYYARVTESQAYAAPAAGGSGAPFVYDLLVFCEPPPEPDVYEPNDTPATATPLTFGTPYDASVHIAGDQDFYGFSLTGDTAVFCDADSPDGGGDTVFELLNNGNLLACDDDSSPNGVFLSQFECCLPPGDYVVGVQDWNNNGTIEAYTITCTDLGPCSADPDPLNAVCFDDGDPYGQCPF